MSYFDNGEEFGAESDDNMDEAVYWNLWAVAVVTQMWQLPF